MTFDLSTLFFVTVAYLLLLFLIAYAADRGWIPARVARHPLTYVATISWRSTSASRSRSCSRRCYWCRSCAWCVITS